MKRQTQDIGQCSCEMGRSHLNFLSTPGNTYTLEFSLHQACFATAVNNFFEVDDVFISYEEEQVVEKMNYSVSNQYRYSFQNQEHHDEIRGKGNYINYKYRGYDPRVGRLDWLVDPLAPQYPHYTPYQFSGNKLIHAIELEGLEEVELNSGKKVATGPRSIESTIDLLESMGTWDNGQYVTEWGDGVQGVEEVKIQVNKQMFSSKGEQNIENPSPENETDLGNQNILSPTFQAGLSISGGIVDGISQSYKYGSANVRFAEKINGKIRSADILTRYNQVNSSRMMSNLKPLGRGITGFSVLISIEEFGTSDKSGSDYARFTSSLIITGVSFVPLVGPVISIGLGVADSYGAFDDLYNKFD